MTPEFLSGLPKLEELSVDFDGRVGSEESHVKPAGFPQDFFKGSSPTLKKLETYHLNLASPLMFKGAANLESFANSSRSRLTTEFPKAAWGQVPHLKNLNFSCRGSGFAHPALPDEFLDDLRELKTVKLYSCEYGADFLEGSFSKTAGLQGLIMNEANGVRDLPEDFFTSHQDLQELRLWESDVEEFPEDLLINRLMNFTFSSRSMNTEEYARIMWKYPFINKLRQ